MSPQRDGDGRFSGSAVRARVLERAATSDRSRTPAVSAAPRDPSAAAGRRWGALPSRVWAGVRGVARWYSAINGGQDYQRYVDHLRRNHPGCPVPSERDYWRERYAEAERNPSTRCC